MSRLTEGHEQRTDTMVVQEEEDGDFLSFFVVSDHAVDKTQTQVAEIWFGEYNVEVLVKELEDWLQSRRKAREAAQPVPVVKPQRGAGKPLSS